MLKLRKVELLGFKSFCEKTPITFSGSGITCIVGPNGCGKSNVVDAISWVLGQQSHKMLRAERMADCIFNGTTKRPAMGLAEVTLTLVDPELTEAVAKVMNAPEDEAAASQDGSASSENEIEREHGELQIVARNGDGFFAEKDDAPNDALDAESDAAAGDEASAENSTETSSAAITSPETTPLKKKRRRKPAMHLKPGEVVVTRRLYRSGQSEYLINGRVARLRDVQELFMGIGLGPDSYAIIEQGRIGQVLNSKPMDRRAIIEEAAGITMYKTKKRLSEAKLEAAKLNLSRVNDILVEVEKQMGSLKRQAAKARRYAEVREEMRGLLRVMLASKAEHLNIEAARLATLLHEMQTVEEREASSVNELEGRQERMNARTYELDAELRQTQNLLGQASLELDRAENRITFNREQAAQIESRATRLTVEIEQAEAQAADLNSRIGAQREAVTALREQTGALEAALRESGGQASGSANEQKQVEQRVEELRGMAKRLLEASARQQAEAQSAEEAAARFTAAEQERSAQLQAAESEHAALAELVQTSEATSEQAQQRAQELGIAVQTAQGRLGELKRRQQEISQEVKRSREALSAERARQASIEQILSERAYTDDAVRKLFTANGSGETDGFRAVGLLADYAEVPQEHERALEQFLHEELEYVVVESFDHARAGVTLLRNEMGGSATFFVDSLNKLHLNLMADESPLPEGTVNRLDRLVEFRDPLGPAAKHFLSKLRSAFLVADAETAQRLASENIEAYFLTPDGVCYHGRTVSGGRLGDAGPLALKRELRQHETEVGRLEAVAQQQQEELTNIESAIVTAEAAITSAMAQHVEAEKALVKATHDRDQARKEFSKIEQGLATERQAIGRLQEQAGAAQTRAEKARREHEEASRAREAAETEGAEASTKLAAMREEFQRIQERVVASREELATMSERLASAAAAEKRMAEEIARATSSVTSLRQQHASLGQEKLNLEASCEQLAVQAEELRKEKARLQESQAAFEREWEEMRARAGEVDEKLREARQSLDTVRAQRTQHQVERARNDADRDYIRQTCLTELNAQPEDLMAFVENQAQLLIGEHLIAAETSYNEMKARVEAMGAVNMMALEEYKETEEREQFLRRERDDLVQSIQNTQMTINELDQISKQKFDEAFAFINAHFAIAFQSLFGGGTGEMRLSEADSAGEAGIDIVAQPPGKKLQNVLLLSGGEKALTALSLLIAVFRYQPSPFCILDEVDAPLDEANVNRFNKMLADMCAQTQFIVVTHNRRTMEMGSVLYGVTMQEPGVSKLVSVEWQDAAKESKTAAAASNAA